MFSLQSNLLEQFGFDCLHDFMLKSYAQYFQNAFGDNGKLGYIKAHYDTTGYCQGQTKAINNNILSRVCNVLVMAINKEVDLLLPKVILVVLENDILNAANHYNPGISLLCGKLMEWLANQFHRIITAHKERLPSKSQKFKYPAVLWVSAPNHINLPNINQFRDKFNTSLVSICVLYQEMAVLDLKWDTKNKSLVNSSGKYTATGMATFWMAVNKAFQDWDQEQMRLCHLPLQNKKPEDKDQNKKIVKYRGHASNSNHFVWRPHQTKFKLPTLKN